MRVGTKNVILVLSIVAGFNASAQWGRGGGGFGSRATFGGGGGFGSRPSLGGGGFFSPKPASPSSSWRTPTTTTTQRGWGNSNSGIGGTTYPSPSRTVYPSAPRAEPPKRTYSYPSYSYPSYTNPRPRERYDDSPTTTPIAPSRGAGATRNWWKSEPAQATGRFERTLTPQSESSQGTIDKRGASKSINYFNRLGQTYPTWNRRDDNDRESEDSIASKRQKAPATVMRITSSYDRDDKPLPLVRGVGLKREDVVSQMKPYKKPVHLGNNERTAYEDRAYRLTNSRFLSYMFLHDSPGTCAIMAGGGNMDHFILDYVVCSSLSSPKPSSSATAKAGSSYYGNEYSGSYRSRYDDEYDSDGEAYADDLSTCRYVLDLSLKPFASPELKKSFPGDIESAKILGKRAYQEVGGGKTETFYYIKDKSDRIYYIGEHNFLPDKKINVECQPPKTHRESLDYQLTQQTRRDKREAEGHAGR